MRVLKFPDTSYVHGWLNDPRYLELLPLRERAYKKLSITVLES